MNKKYAESKTWSVKVNKYIEKIKGIIHLNKSLKK